MSPADPRTDRRLRIGVVTSGLDLTGGVERCVLEDTRELVAAGHDVEVWHRASGAAGAVDGRGPGDGRTTDGRRPVPGRQAYDRLQVPTHATGDRSFGFRTAVRDAARFARDGLRLRRARLDVIWLNRPEHLPWGRVVSAVAGVPLVVHLHHAPNYRRIGAIAGGRTHYLAVSNAMARAWAEVGVPVGRITVVPNGVDTALFPAATPTSQQRARRVLGLDDDRPTVLYYGRLSRSKGVLALLAAWSGVLERSAARHPVTVPADPASAPRPPVLVLAGAVMPEDAEAVRSAVAALPEGAVVLLPERPDVVPLLHAADLVVVPSLEPEGFGRVVVEAMSSGRPVVAAASGGTGEILGGGWAGWTVDPSDADALATRVVDVLDRALTDPSLGDRCRAWVRDRYGRSAHVAGLLRSLLEHARR